jgi:hypothetical protein
MSQTGKTLDHEQDAPAYGWLRWLLASSIGGVISWGWAFGVTNYLVEQVIQPPPNSIPGTFTALGLHVLNAAIGGLFGGGFYWILLARSLRRIWSMAFKWSVSSMLSFMLAVLVAIAFPTINSLIARVQLGIGPVGVLMLVGATFGLVTAWASGDTRRSEI